MSMRKEIFLQLLNKENLMPPEGGWDANGKLTTKSIGEIEAIIGEVWQVANCASTALLEIAKKEKQ